MKHITHQLSLLMIMLLFAGYTSMAQTSSSKKQDQTQKEITMKTYLIERDIPGAGKLNADELKGISQKSCSVLKDMGPKIEWIHSYVNGNKIHCIYKAENEELLREHAKKGGFPITSITEVNSIISPATAN
jgi:hypothetical protein